MHDNKKSASLINLSTINTQNGEYKLATDRLNKALDLYDSDSIDIYKDETFLFLGSLYKNLAINYIQLLEYAEAIKYYKLGLKFIKNRDSFRLKVLELIQFISKDIEDENEKNSIEDFFIKIKLLY